MIGDRSPCRICILRCGEGVVESDWAVGNARPTNLGEDSRTWVQCSKMNPIKIDPEIVSGTPCFAGTRVPVKILFDYLAGGYALEGFLEGFPSVTREQAVAVLEMAKEKLTSIQAAPAA